MLASTALSHVTVIDLTRVRAGPTAVRQLADWGAQVLKIEMPAALDEGEGIGGPREDSDFQNVHRNKRGMTLNLKSEEGVAILKQLVARADVVVENFRPDVKDKLGIGYETLAAINPRLIYASISGYGEDGPYRLRPGFDQIAQGMGGLMSITGLPGQGPVRVGIAIADLTAGNLLAFAVMTALYERETTGVGRWVHTSLLEAQIFMLDFQASRYLMSGEVAGQAGNDHPTGVPTGVFPASDGLFNIAAASARVFARCCEALGKPEWKDREEWNTGAKRGKARKEINGAIAEITKHKPTQYWVELFEANGVPCGPINTIDKVFADPQVQHLGIASPVHSETLGDIKLVASPINMTGVSKKIRSATADAGAHTDEVLASVGYTKEQLKDMRAKGVI